MRLRLRLRQRPDFERAICVRARLWTGHPSPAAVAIVMQAQRRVLAGSEVDETQAIGFDIDGDELNPAIVHEGSGQLVAGGHRRELERRRGTNDEAARIALQFAVL